METQNLNTAFSETWPGRTSVEFLPCLHGIKAKLPHTPDEVLESAGLETIDEYMLMSCKIGQLSLSMSTTKCSALFYALEAGLPRQSCYHPRLRHVDLNGCEQGLQRHTLATCLLLVFGCETN